MGETLLPPGFRFHPTDEELVGYYLKRKVDGLEIELEVIPVIDLYKFDPWELPERSFLPKQDMQWFFFCPRDRKYPNGLRTNRATAAGYWKATGKERKIVCQSAVTGFRKSLVFYCGRAPLGYRTDWMMHEYRLGDDLPQGSSGFQAPFALYRVIKKNEQGLKMGEIQGEPKAKRVGGTSITGNFIATGFSSEFLSTSNENPSQATCLYNGSNYSSPVTSSNEFTRMAELDPTLNGTNLMSIGVSPDLVFDSSEDYSNSIASWKYCDYTEHSLPSSCSNIQEEVDPVSDLNQIDCMSPYSAPINYTGLYRSEDETYQSFNWSGS